MKLNHTFLTVTGTTAFFVLLDKYEQVSKKSVSETQHNGLR